MKKYIFALSILITSVSVFCQTELGFDSISFPGQQEKNIIGTPRYTAFPKLGGSFDGYGNVPPAGSSSFSYFENTTSSLIGELPHDIYYQGPPLAPRYDLSQPFINDYNYAGIIGLSDRIWITGGSIQQSYPGYGAIRGARAVFNYQPADWLIVSAGTDIKKYDLYRQQHEDVRLNANLRFLINNRMNVDVYGNSSVYRQDNGLGSYMASMYPEDFTFGTRSYLNATRNFGIQYNYSPADWVSVSTGTYGRRYELFNSGYNDYGLNANIGLKAHERVKFNVYGSRSFNNRFEGAGPLNSTMFPQNYYGGNMEIKISDKVGIVTGVDRELNPITGKWETKPYIYPVFY